MYSPIGVDNNGKLNTLGGDAVQAIVESSIPDVSTFVSRDELQNYALAADIPDTSQFIDSAELDAAIQEGARWLASKYEHTLLEQRVTALENAPSGGTVTLVESPAGSGLYEIQGG